MDGNGSSSMNLRNWGFPNSSLKSHLSLELMSSISENHHTHPSSSVTAGGPFHHHRVGGISESHIPMDYWMNHNNNRDKYLNILPGHGYYQPNHGVLPETSSSHSIQMQQSKNESVIALKERDNASGGLVKKRGGGKVPNSPPKEKKQRTKDDKDESTPSLHRARAPKKCAEVVINGTTMDISGIPIPVCSCTGTPQQCYRWGSGGWQSACCTTSLSTYPLPMSTKRRGARIAGRKMSIGAFKKVLEKLASEGYDFSNQIDLKGYWAKHGTNKFVTIR
ncbi:hypothetical protein ACJIZ3_004408 [Penstemon smallii]|uniref:GAGA-binding transcriptional activator n=1 Tax=Penstemon smallii TaxID=265156 RepID=A0ABD3S267_9LAMI